MNSSNNQPDLKGARRIRKQYPTASIDRLPPHSPEAEQGVLGCIMLDPARCLPECVTSLRMGAEAFYDLRHQMTYEALLQMSSQAEMIDTITLQQHLKDKQLLEQVGGVEFIATLPDTVPSAANLGYYLDIIREKYLLRKMIHTCTDFVARVYDHVGDAEELLGRCESEILSIRQTSSPECGIIDLSCLSKELLDHYQNAFEGKGKVGIKTGFTDLDRILGGIYEQEMVVLAGHPSSGKTTLALNIAQHVSNTQCPVGVISLETSNFTVGHRVACADGKVGDGARLLSGNPTEGDLTKMSVAIGRMSKSKGRYLLGDGGTEMSQIEATARQLYQKGARFLVIDYLQLIKHVGNGEYERTSNISKSIKALARQLNCPVLVISSLNRESAKDNREPQMSDLRNSGQIEYDASKILLVWSPQDEEGNITRIKVAKNKEGKTGKLDLVFFPESFRFENVATVIYDEPFQPKERPARNGYHNQHPACPTD